MKHLYHNCTLAINADTGKIVWYYQHVVDHWDLDHPFERLLVDTAVAPNPRDVMWINPKVKAGERRKVITGIPGKTGLVYTLDRPDRRVPLGAADRRAERHQHDRRQRRGHRQPGGALHEDQRGEGHLPGQQRRQELAGRRVQPADQHDVHADAEHVHDGHDHHGQARPVEGLRPQHAAASWRPATDKVGTVWAISAETGTTTWKHEQRAGMMSLVATGGGLVFGGDANGRFKALDDRTGKVLWDMNLGSSVSGYPISFAVDGKQYVAVITGPSLVANSDRARGAGADARATPPTCSSSRCRNPPRCTCFLPRTISSLGLRLRRSAGARDHRGRRRCR